MSRALYGCGGSCNQGRGICDCELSCEIGLDATRPFPAPPPLPDDMRTRLTRRALYLSALLFGVLAGLLEAFGASPFEVPQ